MIKLLNIDCMEHMKTCSDKQYDLAIVDPPYGIKINMNAGRKKDTAGKKRVNKKWDNAAPSDEFFKELFRISSNQIIWGGNYFSLPPVRGWIFWDKIVAKGISFADGELAWTSFDSVLRKVSIQYSGFLGMEDRFHPTQKPVNLYKWLLKNYAKSGDKILDTHGGSMSIALACYDMGFDLTLCEIDKEYYDAGVKRYNDIPKNQLFSPSELYPNVHKDK